MLSDVAQGGETAGLRAAHEVRRGLGDRPDHVRGGRPLPARARELQHVVPSWDMSTLYASDDRGNQLTPFDPMTGTPGHADPGHRPVQPVLHPGRPLGDLGRGAAPRAGVLRPAHLAGAGHPAHPGLRRHRPRRLHPRRPHRRVHLRVRRTRRRGRRRRAPPAAHDRHAAAGTRAWARRTSSSPRTARCSTSPTATRTGCGSSTAPRPEGPAGDPDRRAAHTGSTCPATPRKLYVTNRHEGSVSVLDAYTGAAARQVAHTRRRQPRHGQRHRRRQPAVALRPLRPRRLRAVHRRRPPDPQDRRRATARTGCASGRSRAATRSATRASPDNAKGVPGRRGNRPGETTRTSRAGVR